MTLEKNQLWLWGDMLNLAMDDTSTYVACTKQKVTYGKWQVTFCFIQVVDEDNCIVVKTFGIMQDSAYGCWLVVFGYFTQFHSFIHSDS